MSNIVKLKDTEDNLSHFKQLAAIAAKSGTTQMSQEVMLNIMLTAHDLGISPMKAINGGFYVVNGKISMSTALMVDRIRKEGHSIKIKAWTADKCVIFATRKDNGDSVEFEFSMQDAQTAGLTNSPTWKKFPKQMLYNRAMSTIARTLFPDVVGNAYSEDERWDIMNVAPAERPLEDPDAITILAQDDQCDMASLKSKIDAAQIDSSHLEDYVRSLADRKGQPIELIIESAMRPELFDRFSMSYAKEVARRNVSDEAVTNS